MTERLTDRLTERLTDRLYCSRLLWLYLLLMVLAAWQVLFQTQVQTDMSAFMPKAQDKAQQLLLQQLEQGPAARLWMLALTRAAPEILADISVKLAHKASDSALVKQVINGNLVLDQVTRDRLFEYRYLLSNRVTGDTFTRQGLQQMFNDLLDVLRSPLSTFSAQLSRADPGGELLHLLQSFGTEQTGPGLQHGVWFNDQGDQALLLLQSSASGTDLDAQLQLHRQLLLWLDELTQSDTDRRSVILKLAGLPLISLETREHIRHSSQQLSILASIFMFLFMFFIYRHPRKVLLTALPLLSGVLMGVACVSWWFAGVHGITLAFGITLLGVAVDYPVHVLSHQRAKEGLEQTAARIWPTLALSVLSTVLGFSAMLWTDFPGLAQLGLFSMSGLITAVLVTRYMLPLLAGAIPVSSSRHWRWRRERRRSDFNPTGRTKVRPTHGGTLGWALSRVPRWLARETVRQLALLVCILSILLTTWSIHEQDFWSRNIQALSPVPAEVRLADQQMRQAMGAPGVGHVMLLTAASIEQLLVKQEQLQPLLGAAVSRGYVERVDYAAAILPSERLQMQRRSWIPGPQTLATDLQLVLQSLPFKSDGFGLFAEALEHSRQLQPMTPDMLEGSALGMRLNSLLQPSELGVNGLIQLVGVNDVSGLADLLQVSSRQDLWLLDIPQATSELVDDFREEVMGKAMLALALIGLLVGLWLRSISRWLKVMMPVLLSVIVSITVVLATGASLNLFHLVSLLLVAGIGLDYALFFSRSHAGSDEWQQTRYALTVCCVSTVVVFSLLAASDIPVLHAIGLTVASGAVAAFGLSWFIFRTS